MRRLAPAILALVLLLPAACSEDKAPGGDDASTSDGDTGGDIVSTGETPPNEDELAEAATADPEIGDPTAPGLPPIPRAVVDYLQDDGEILLRFHAESEPLVLGDEDCATAAGAFDAAGFVPRELYDAAAEVPDETISSAFTNDIAEKLRHVGRCDRAPLISFTHTVIARLLAEAGLL